MGARYDSKPRDREPLVVARLLEFYDPFYLLFQRHHTPALAQAVAQARVQQLPWAGGIYRPAPPRWHLGRVRYFCHQLQQGIPCEPLDVDNYCERLHIYGPILLDGHHRLCGAVLAAVPQLTMRYSGRIDLLHYLTGRRRTAPKDLA